MDERYCKLCGNEQVPYDLKSEDPLNGVCPRCADAVGRMPRAWALYREAFDRYKHCCSRISSDVAFEGRGGAGFGPKTHLYFHSEDFNTSYPPDAKENEAQTCVEAGIHFYKDKATCYWIFDADTVSDSFDLDGEVPYPPEGEDTEPFWEALEKILNGAAEAAWNTDVLTCSACGYHYNASVEECGCREGDEDEA